ncbi:hypothetical protein BKA70DRAFT_1437623 [Coprinopsis sp. MPI-PUGE-AT-0042]|nr:hypothetical protein BKA70DRAFT_1437623 [Coprinopsis sp. MPI-PUGE-AT-0042]
MLQHLANVILFTTLALSSGASSNALPPGITAAPAPATTHLPGSSPSWSLVTTKPCTQTPFYPCPPFACPTGYTYTNTYDTSLSACMCAGCGPTGVWHNVPAPTNTCACPGCVIGGPLCPDGMSLVFTTTASSRCNLAGCYDAPGPTPHL